MIKKSNISEAYIEEKINKVQKKKDKKKDKKKKVQFTSSESVLDNINSKQRVIVDDNMDSVTDKFMSTNYDKDDNKLIIDGSTGTMVKANNSTYKEHNDKYNHHELIVYSDKATDPEFYNDYCVSLNKVFKNVIALKLKSYHIPDFKNVIDSNNDSLTIILKKHKIRFEMEMEHGSFTIHELIDRFNTEFENNEAPLQMNIIDNYINIKTTDNQPFNIIDNEHSMKMMLGFTKAKYRGDNNYIADVSFNILYLFLGGFSQEQNTDFVLNTSQLESNNNNFENKPIKELTQLIIKFKRLNDIDSYDMYDFNEKPHKLIFDVITNNTNN